MSKNKKISRVNVILIIQLVVMIALVIIITKTVGSSTRQNADDHMATITEERAHIIDSYVDRAEKTLCAYARAGQIIDLLKNPDDSARRIAAQLYTEAFSKDIVDLEGIYASKWDTTVLTHTNALLVGNQTRKEAGPQEALHTAMLAPKNRNGVYNTGIIPHPLTGVQVVSMYKAVLDENNNPIGLVGLGLYTKGLIENLNALTIRGIEQSSYTMVNAGDKKYIFNPVEDKVNTEATNQDILDLCEKYNNYDKDDSGKFEYKDENGDTIVSSYAYMSTYNWLLMLDGPKNEIYSLTIRMRIFLSIFGVLIIGLAFVFALINKAQEATSKKLSSQIAKNEKTRQSLTTAMFKDILTEVGNRVAFSMDVQKLQPEDGKAYYFILFNISKFSEINTNYSTETGDQILLGTSHALQKLFANGTFENGKLYRTGSDEFVVVVQADNSNAGYQKVINSVNTAHAALLAPQETPNGEISAEYKIAVVKKNSTFNASIISILKDMTNRTGNAVFGQVQYTDLDLRS